MSEETKTAEEMFKQRQTIIIEQNYPYEKGVFGKLIEKITIGKSRFDGYIVLHQETPMGVNRGSLFIHETKAKEVATAIYPELTQQQEINAELKKQNAELIDLVKQAQNFTARTSKESFERYDRFMARSTEVLRQIESTT